MKTVVILAALLCAGAGPDVVEPSAKAPLPPHKTFALDTTPKQRRRMVPPEVFVRAYLTWFGGLAPLDVQQRAAPLFDQWKDYVAALGLPNYKIDLPRTPQSNAIMMAATGKLAEALCIRAVEHDFAAPMAQRLIFAFDDKPQLTAQEFAPRFDVLHRTFLGYPAALAPKGRTAKFYALFRDIAADHGNTQTAWAAVCTALVLHPETELY